MSATRRFAFAGVAFGVMFPVIGSMVEAAVRSGAISVHTVVHAQHANPLLWIIDTAPFWLGVFASFAGRRQDRLVALHAELQRANAERLNPIPTSLADTKTELTAAAGSLAELTRSLNAMVQRQASSLAETATTMHEIRQTSAVASSKAAMVMEVAGRAEELSESGQASVDASLQGLEAIRQQIDQIVSRHTELSERMFQVGEIVESVKDIADQSNMLALNAAIEAVRAGESGKGFSVVAREIRSLADRSIDSTKRIRQILEEIQTAIRATVTITEQGQSKMERSMRQIHTSGENLRGMTAIVHESSQSARQIAAAVSQQSAGTAQIATAIADLNATMEQTVSEIRRAEKAAGDLDLISAKISEIIDAFAAMRHASAANAA